MSAIKKIDSQVELLTEEVEKLMESKEAQEGMALARELTNRATAELSILNHQFLHSEMFRQACQSAFDEVDMDRTRALDVKELWVALLLMYNNLNSHLPVHLQPPTREQVTELLQAHADPSGYIYYEEFTELCRGMLVLDESGMYFKIATQVGVTCLLIPAACSLLCNLPICSKVPAVFIAPAVGTAGTYIMRARPKHRNKLLTYAALVLGAGLLFGSIRRRS